MDPLFIPWVYVETTFWYLVTFVVAVVVGLILAGMIADEDETEITPSVYVPFLIGFFGTWVTAAYHAGYIVFV